MKKRLRRKLSKGEFAHPYPHTKKQQADNLIVASALAHVIGEVGAERFLAFVEQHNQASGLITSASYWLDSQISNLLSNPDEAAD
jgi:hypothetical protein